MSHPGLHQRLVTLPNNRCADTDKQQYLLRQVCNLVFYALSTSTVNQGEKTDPRTRGPQRFFQERADHPALVNSFFPRTLREWDQFPQGHTRTPPPEAFVDSSQASGGPTSAAREKKWWTSARHAASSAQTSRKYFYHQSDVPDCPWPKVRMDSFDLHGKKCVTVVDYLSREAKIYLVQRETASATIQAAKSIFACAWDTGSGGRWTSVDYETDHKRAEKLLCVCVGGGGGGCACVCGCVRACVRACGLVGFLFVFCCFW